MNNKPKYYETKFYQVRISTLLIVAYVALSPFKIELIGQLYASELFAALCILFLGVPVLLKKYPALFHVLIAYVVLLIGLILSDFLNGSTPTDYLRGWASIVFSGIVLIFFVALFDRNPKSMLWFLVATIIVSLITAESVFEVSRYQENPNYIKVTPITYLIPVTLLIAYFLELRSRIFTALFLILVGSGLVVLNARSAGIGIIAGGMFILFIHEKLRINIKFIIKLFLSVLIAYTFYYFYIKITIDVGIQGNTLMQLSDAENPYNPFTLLFLGRTESLVALQAISDRPLVGFGSWGKDVTGEYWNLLRELKELSGQFHRDYIPSHSVILTGWLWGGFLGLIGVIYLFLNSIKHFLAINGFPSGLRIIAYCLCANMIWHFLFSPFGHLRSSIPLALAFVIVLKVYCEKTSIKRKIQNPNCLNQNIL